MDALDEFAANDWFHAPDMTLLLELAAAGELFHNWDDTYRLTDGRLALVSEELRDASGYLWDWEYLTEDTTDYRALLTDDGEPVAVLEHLITITGRALLARLTTPPKE